MIALILINCVIRGANLADVFEPFSVGYATGKRSEPLFGTDWDALWDRPIDEVRAGFGIDRSGIVGADVSAACMSPTHPGKVQETYLAPLEGYIEKTWVLNDFERL